VSVVAHARVEERTARGTKARDQEPPSGHVGWVPAAARPDAVALLEEQSITREPDPVPVVMAECWFPVHVLPGRGQDHGLGPEGHAEAGLMVQLCGHADLSNFGGFAPPKRTLLLDLDDFDELGLRAEAADWNPGDPGVEFA